MLIAIVLEIISFAINTLKGSLQDKIKEITSKDKRAIRAFVTLYDSLLELETKSNELISVFKDFAFNESEIIKEPVLRRNIREFSTAVCRFVNKFWAVNRSLRIFDDDIYKFFTDIGGLKIKICRSLLEITSPNICIKNISPNKGQYFIRILNYNKFKRNLDNVQRRWEEISKSIPSGFVLPLPEETKKNVTKLKELVKTVKEEWISSQDPFYQIENRINDNENAIRKELGFDIIPFSDKQKLREVLNDSDLYLEKLKKARISLEDFIKSNFSVNDFF